MTRNKDDEPSTSRIADIPKEIREQIEFDASIYGNGYAEKLKDGTWRRIDPTTVAVSALKDNRPSVYGVPLLMPKKR